VLVAIRFWGVTERLAGTALRSLDLPEGATVGDAVARLAALPGLAAELPRCAFAVGDALVRRSHPLSDGMELAILPPVSGG